jgi:surface-anchored protein
MTLWTEGEKAMFNSNRLLQAAALVTVGAISTASAGPVVFTNSHVDIEAVWAGPAGWEFKVHDQDNNIEYDADDVILTVLSGAQQIRPPGAQWNFLGVAAGQPVWVLPQTQNPNLLYLGVAAEDEDGTLLPSGVVTLRLTGLVAPGDISVWSFDSFGNPDVRIASFGGIGIDDRLEILVGSHEHFFWGFSQPGVYEVTFEASAPLLAGGTTPVAEGTYTFNVIPEPTGIAMVGVGAMFLLARRRR